MDSYTDVSTQCCGRGRMSCGTSFGNGCGSYTSPDYPDMNAFPWDSWGSNPALSYPTPAAPVTQPICRVPPQREACWNSSFRWPWLMYRGSSGRPPMPLKEALSRGLFSLTWIYSLITGGAEDDESDDESRL